MDRVVLRHRRLVRSSQEIKDRNPVRRILLSPLVVFLITTLVYCSMSIMASKQDLILTENAAQQKPHATLAGISLD